MKNEKDQFKKGQNVLGFLDMLCKNPNIFFVHCRYTLNAGTHTNTKTFLLKNCACRNSEKMPLF